MEIIRDLSLAVGLEWVLYDSGKEAKSALKGAKGAVYVRRISGGECVQAVAKRSDFPKKAFGKYRAGALMVASVVPNALVCHQISDDKYWVCAIRDGIPLHGYDSVVNESEAHALLGEAMSYVQNAEVIGAITGATKTVPEILASIDKKTAKSCGFAESGIPVVPIFLALVLLAGSYVGFVSVTNLIENARKEKTIAEMIAAQMRSEEEKRRMLEKAKADYRAKVAQARNEFFDTVFPSQQFRLWSDLVRSLPLSHGGWLVSSVECNQNECNVKWFRKDIRAPLSMGETLPGEVVSATPDEIVRRVPLPKLDTVHSSAYPDLIRFVNDVPSLAGWLKGTSARIDAQLQTVTLPAPAEGITAETIGREGSWSISGSVEHVATVLGKMDLPGVFIVTAKFGSFKNGVPSNIEVAGKYRAN